MYYSERKQKKRQNYQTHLENKSCKNIMQNIN